MFSVLLLVFLSRRNESTFRIIGKILISENKREQFNDNSTKDDIQFENLLILILHFTTHIPTLRIYTSEQSGHEIEVPCFAVPIPVI